jgi:L-aspartate oxidase
MNKYLFENSIIKADVLVIGSGLAGLLTAILCYESGARVIVASKSALSASNTAWAQGGIAAVTAQIKHDDSFEGHLSDTIKAGAGLTENNTAEEILRAAPDLVSTLARFGVEFDRSSDGSYELAREGGHSYSRVLHSKDTTGRTIAQRLSEKVFELAAAPDQRMLVLENTFAERLLKRDGRVSGAVLIHEHLKKPVFAQHVVLATGGAGQMYARTTNPSIATADGLALAYRAGATLADLEFMQFHPTALSVSGAPPFLISEAVRGEGAKLLDGNGVPFMRRFHRDGELATRDLVSRAIHTVMIEQSLSAVSLDLRPIGASSIMRKFPNITKTCREFGIDPLSEPIPVAPAAHYFMGGVLTDISGKTNVPELFCIGEAANTGLHGANRLASNSLLEAGVMAMKLAQALAARKDWTSFGMVRKGDGYFYSPTIATVPEQLQGLRDNMYRLVSLERSEEGLRTAQKYLATHRCLVADAAVDQLCHSNMLLVAELIVEAALQRRESRGAHFRVDYPVAEEAYRKHLAVADGSWQWKALFDSDVKVAREAALTA